MRPWYTPLSQMGNYDSVIVYDARKHRIWIIDQEGFDTTDPAIRVYWHDREDQIELGEPLGDDMGKFQNGMSSSLETSGDDNGSQETSKNRNNFEHIRSRPAGDVLRDMNRWYRELKELPGQGEYTDFGLESPKKLRQLYVKHGWPNKFDGDAFDIDYTRARCVNRAASEAEEPLRRVEGFERVIGDVTADRWKQEVKAAKKTDALWVACLKLWKEERFQLSSRNNLEEARKEADRLCPGGKCQRDEDLPLWKLEMLRVEMTWKIAWISDDWPGKFTPAKRRHADNEAALYTKAYEASKVDAQRLCPGRTFTEVTGMKPLDVGDDLISSRIEEHRSWSRAALAEAEMIRNLAAVEGVPEDALEAQAMVKQEIESALDRSQRKEREAGRYEKLLAEQGDTD